MPTARSPDNKLNLTPAERLQRRHLILQDSLALLALTLIAICIGVLTYFFFNSFAEHRSVLETRWFDRGDRSLAAGRPAEAVEDFRSALSFSSTNAKYQMALAEALAASGRTEEAFAYFSTLHDAQPGDGFLNLQLARLEVRRRNPQQAIQYYQGALNGLWHGEGAERRFQIRLELAKYLISQQRPIEAQGQLLSAEGNSLDNPTALFAIANLLEQASDPTDALRAFQRVERHGGAHPSLVLKSLLAESQIAASMGQYKRAAQALDRYMARSQQHPRATIAQQKQSVEQQLDRLQRMLQLIPFYALPPRQRVQRVLLGARIAHSRYAKCLKALTAEKDANANQPDLLALGAAWTHLGSPNAHALEGNAPLQLSVTSWTGRAETVTAKYCGPPTGDDALLLQLAQTPDKTE